MLTGKYSLLLFVILVVSRDSLFSDESTGI